MVVILFIVLGIAIIDGSSILFGKWQLSDAADAGAIDAAVAYESTKNLDDAKAAAQAIIDDRLEGATVTKVTVNDDGSLTVVVTKTASTIFVKRLGATEDWGHLRVESTASRPTA
jgi:Flp pilus assembly protein TadG